MGVVTDDGRTVSPHFGRAPFYMVYEIEAGSIKKVELRPKAAHQHGEMGHHTEGSQEQHAAGESMHDMMLSNVADCEALIARGMGRPMYEAILSRGIKPFLTGETSPEEAVKAYIRGTLDNHPDELH